jgi:hypothetical protein
MKLRTILLAFLMVLGMALGGASYANAGYALWYPEIGDVQTGFGFNTQGGTCDMTANLYINAAGATQGAGNPGNALLLQMTLTNPFSAVDFSVILNGPNDWVVNYTSNSSLGGFSGQLNLGSTNAFGLYYIYNGQVVQPNVSQQDIEGLQWLLTNGGSCNQILITDAAPVGEGAGAPLTPIPTTLLLFGPGLAGVFGFLRRFSG